MKNNRVIDVEKALTEKKAMQKVFVRDHSYPSSVLALVIAYFEKGKRKGGEKKKHARK